MCACVSLVYVVYFEGTLKVKIDNSYWSGRQFLLLGLRSRYNFVYVCVRVCMCVCAYRGRERASASRKSELNKRERERGRCRVLDRVRACWSNEWATAQRGEQRRKQPGERERQRESRAEESSQVCVRARVRECIGI